MSALTADSPGLSLLDEVYLPGATRFPRIVKVAAPAVGAELVIPVPGGVVWKIEAIRAQLVTSATVATRLATMRAGDGSTTPIIMPAGSTQVASLTVVYEWLRGLSTAAGSGALGISAVGFGSALLPGGWQLQTVTANIDTDPSTGDAWSAVSLYVVELRPPAPTALLST